MSIKVVCPNGHALKVCDSMAGKVGLCPKCRARVVVPKPRSNGVSEDAILDLLGSHSPRPAPHAFTGSADDLDRTAHPSAEPTITPKKNCSKCNREIPTGMHICPHCHTYIAGLADF
jgi:hypothetical protein